MTLSLTNRRGARTFSVGVSAETIATPLYPPLFPVGSSNKLEAILQNVVITHVHTLSYHDISFLLITIMIYMIQSINRYYHTSIESNELVAYTDTKKIFDDFTGESNDKKLQMKALI